MSYPSYIHDTGTGTPIVFIHAFPLHSGMWAEQHAGLHTRVISLDIPGFGHGGPVQESTTIGTYAAILFDVLNMLNIPQAIIGGCSMGGYIAMEALRKDPSRISGLILANTRAGADSEETRANRYAQMEEIRTQGTSALIDTMSEKLVSAQTKSDRPHVVHTLRTIMGNATPDGIIAALRAMALRQDSMETLRTAQIPACIITGKDDALIPPSEAEVMHTAMQHSELHVISGTGHMTPLERPDIVNAILSAFLERLP